jgi:hypothetical protein
MPPVTWFGIGLVAAGAVGAVGAATVLGVATAAVAVSDAAGLGEVGLDRDEVVGRLEAGPQPDSSATAPSSAVIDPTALFIRMCPRNPWFQPWGGEGMS